MDKALGFSSVDGVDSQVLPNLVQSFNVCCGALSVMRNSRLGTLDWYSLKYGAVNKYILHITFSSINIHLMKLSLYFNFTFIIIIYHLLFCECNAEMFILIHRPISTILLSNQAPHPANIRPLHPKTSPLHHTAQH